MQNATNKTIYDLIDALAPFESQEEFDNAGFLIGDMHAPVKRVLVTLDASREVIEEAQRLEATLIVSHHPVMFHGAKTLLEANFEGAVIQQLIRSGLSLISAHTNLDKTELSGAALIAKDLGLVNTRLADPFVLLGDLPKAMTAEKLGKRIAGVLGSPIRAFGSADQEITTLGIAGGGYDEGWHVAREQGAQAYLTGEVRHHNALAAASSGIVLYDGGHHQTEVPMVHALCRYLQSQLNTLQYDVEVYASQATAVAAGYTLEEET